MPSFGEFLKKQNEIKQNYYKECESASSSSTEIDPYAQRVLNIAEKSKIPLIKDIVGVALSKIGSYQQLNNKEHVVAQIDEVINFQNFNLQNYPEISFICF